MSDSTQGPTCYRNPLYSGYFADPFVFRHGDAWYAVGTGPESCPAGSDRGVFPMLWSPDFANWEPLGYAMPRPDVEGVSFWAPEIAFRDGRFFLYYSVGTGDKGHRLRVAESTGPGGPYLDVGLLLDDPACPFAIDPHPFQDVDGRWYLFYARDFLDSSREVRPGTALAATPLDDPYRVAGDFITVARATRDWQRYLADRIMYGGVYDWHTLEGPFVVVHDGVYTCFYSGGNWQNASYGVDYMTATHPMGPWHADSATDYARVIRSRPGHVIGPGHNSIVEGPGGTTYFVYHAWDPEMTARRMCADPLLWDETGPRCEGPSVDRVLFDQTERERP